MQDIFAKCITLREEERKPMVAIVEKFVKGSLIPMMRDVDPVFNNLFEEVYHTGSYYSVLKVGNARESRPLLGS